MFEKEIILKKQLAAPCLVQCSVARMLPVSTRHDCRSEHTRCGPPSFASAKGGYDDGIHNGRCRTDKSCAGSIAAHPCKKRKDGAPSAGMVQCKDGPPAPESMPSDEITWSGGPAFKVQKPPHLGSPRFHVEFGAMAFII